MCACFIKSVIKNFGKTTGTKMSFNTTKTGNIIHYRISEVQTTSAYFKIMTVHVIVNKYTKLSNNLV